jgi:hypothetical protein
MTSVRVRNRVRDFDEWKAVFDKFERFRQENGVLGYRLCRRSDDEHDVEIILDFGSVADAEEFRRRLQRIWASPQSRSQLLTHEEPVILDVVEERTLVAP